jgi:hypothetical protein
MQDVRRDPSAALLPREIYYGFAEGEIVAHYDGAHLVEYVNGKGGIAAMMASLDRAQFEHVLLNLHRQAENPKLDASLKETLAGFLQDIQREDFDLADDDDDEPGGPLFQRVLEGRFEASLASLGLKDDAETFAPTDVEIFFFQKWKECFVGPQRNLYIPTVSFKIDRKIPNAVDNHGIPQDPEKFVKKAQPISPPPPLPHPHFFDLMVHLCAAVQYDRAHEAIAFCFDILCREEFNREPKRFLAWGFLATLLGKIGCSEALVVSCLSSMRSSCAAARFESHRINCLCFEQQAYGYLGRSKLAGACFKDMMRVLPSTSQIYVRIVTVYVVTKLRRIEDLLILAQCFRDTKRSIPGELMERIYRKIRNLNKLLHRVCGKGKKATQPIDLLKVYNACYVKLKNEQPLGRTLDFIELDNDVQFYLKTKTEHDYRVTEYDVEMKEARLGDPICFICD